MLYRLKYLCLLGLVTRVDAREFSLTKLGGAYLAMSRREGNHKTVLGG